MRVTYIFDPLCGWCYGASPALERLASDPAVELELLTAGLFASEGARQMDAGFAAYAWANDQRIARLTGQVFSVDYRHRVLADHSRPFDSGPASLALAAVALTAPAREFEALKQIQLARYVQGRDITDPAVLAEVLDGLELGEAARRLRLADEALIGFCRQRIAEAGEAMRRFAINGVPALLIGDGAAQRPVSAGALFAGADGLMDALRAA